MAFYDTTWYVNSVGHAAVLQRQQSTSVVVGQIVRQFTMPAVNSERCFICIIAGITAATTDATWVLTRGAKTVDGTVTWQECTGSAAINGDLTNTQTWTQAKVIGTPTLGAIIKRNNSSSYQICSTAGTLGAAEPGFSDTAGTTTTESGGTAIWTSLGSIANYPAGGAPHARLTPALATNWFAANNTIFIANNHAETAAAFINITGGASTAASTGKILCHNHLGGYPPLSSDLATGATITTTGTNGISWNLNGAFYVYGLTFKLGVGSTSIHTLTISAFNATTSGQQWYYFDNCSFQLWVTGSSQSDIQFDRGVFILNNTTMRFGHVNHFLDVWTAQLLWQNTAPILTSDSAIPTRLLSPDGGLSNVVFEALDLSQLTSALFYDFDEALGSFTIKDCKLSSIGTIGTSFTPVPLHPSKNVQPIRCGHDATGAYKSSRYAYEGVELTETIVTRVNGACDPMGQTQLRKIATTGNPVWLRPFKLTPYAKWNLVVGADVGVTIYGLANGTSLPANDEVWMDVEYLGDASSPLGTIVTTTKSSILSENMAVTADDSEWGEIFTVLDGAPTRVDVSADKLTVTNLTGQSDNGVRSLFFQNTGKYYFEITDNGMPQFKYCHVGILLSSGQLSNIYENSCTVFQWFSGAIYANGSYFGQIGSPPIGSVIGCAVDLDVRRAWFRINGGFWNGAAISDPVNNVNGVTIGPGSFSPVVHFDQADATGPGLSVTANFGQFDYVYPPPEEFINWGDHWLPFKLTKTIQPALPGYMHVRVKVARPTATFFIDPQIILS